ncbi:MAG: TonB-dependent receptor [Opitutales bacterium]|nr:TonB-dependent receptor [Opitutales bacterium]
MKYPSLLFGFGLNAALSALLRRTVPVVLCLLAASSLWGQYTGNVEGRVLNALTGNYMNRAVVTVEGTSIRAFTNNAGEYSLRGVPEGRREIRVQFTGMNHVVESVDVVSGITVSQDFTFRRRRGEEDPDDVFELAEFVVDAAGSFRSFADIAVQEERFSPNLRNVVAADAYGNIAQGNIGEFIKFVPGVSIDYGGAYSSGADATEISVRGFRPDQTSVTIDGVPISGAQPGSLTRAVSLDMLSINNASRVEVIKVPTPDQPLASIGGSINLISKTAFEYPKPTFSFRTYLAMNSEHLTLFRRTPGPMHDRTYKVIPGVDLSYAWPINEKIGLTFNYAMANQFNANRTYEARWTPWVNQAFPRIVTVDGELLENAYPDVTRPFLDNIKLEDSPRISKRTSGSVKVDYAPFSGHLITLNYQYSTFSASDAGRRVEVNAGGSQGIYEYGPDYVISRDGAGKAEINVTALDREGETHSGYLRWSFIKGPWDILAVGSASVSDGELVSVRNGRFSGLDLRMGGIHKTIISGIVDGVPESVEYFDEDGNSMDPAVLDSYRIVGYDPSDPSASRLKVMTGESITRSENYSGRFDVKRNLDFLPTDDFMQLSVKTGVYWQERRERKWGAGTTSAYQYMGQSGVELNLGDFRDDYYIGVSPGFGFEPREWPDTVKLYRYFLDNPDAFSNTNDQPIYSAPTTGLPNDVAGVVDASIAANNWSSFVNQQKAITETTLSHYMQLESSFFNHRLMLVGGYRQEESRRRGRTPFTDNDARFLRLPQDSRGDGLLDVAIYREVPWSIFNPIPLDVAQGLESMGAVYADGAPFLVSELDPFIWEGTGRIPFQPHQVPMGRYIDGMWHAPVPDGTLRRRQFQQIPNYEIDEKSKGRPAPMVSGAYDITEQLVFRAAWSRKYAAPAYEGAYGILRSVTFSQPRDGSPGRINVGNPSLRPWSSDDWDFGISYYTESGGKYSFNYFTKSISDMHRTRVVRRDFNNLPEEVAEGRDPLEVYLEVLAELGFGPNSIYAQEDWEVTTLVNWPDGGKQYGWEVDFQQDLSILGGWGQYFYLFAAYSTKRRTVSETVEDADAQFGNNAPDNFASGGLNFNYRRFTTRVNVTWRNEQIISRGAMPRLTNPHVPRNTNDLSTFDPIPFEAYRPAEFRVDLNMSYRLSDRYTLDFAARNITDTGRVRYIRSLDGSFPEYAMKGQRSQYGVNFTVGLSGRF